MGDLSQLLHEMIDELTPVHLAQQSFADGGWKRGQDIARFHAKLITAEQLAFELETEVAFQEEFGPTEEADELKAEEQPR